MTNDYRERLDQSIQTALVALLKYPPSGFKVDRTVGAGVDITFTLPDAYSARVLGPLYAAMHEPEPSAEETKKLVVPPYGATCANGPPQGSTYRGWRVCGANDTEGRAYHNTGGSVFWLAEHWVLRHYFGAEALRTLCKGSLDEALDRAKEMMR